MHELVPPPASAVANTHCTAADYDRLYRQSLDDPDSFWRSQLGRLDWDSEPTIMGNWSYDPVTIKSAESRIIVERGRIAKVTNAKRAEATSTTSSS